MDNDREAAVSPKPEGLPAGGLLAAGVVVCDGAMGTMLHSAGAPLDRALCELNLTAPRLVHDLHAAYAAAGARIVQTNTFDANRLRLARFGLEDSTVEINIAGARLAREAVRGLDPPVLVAGSVGPATSATIVPRVPHEARISTLREQIAALADWVDLVILETFGDIESLAQAAEVALAECDLPVIAQMTFGDDGRTLRGEKPADMAAVLSRLDVVAIGANCSAGPSVLHDVVAELAGASSLPVSVQPNAGTPMRLGRQLRYAHNIEYFAHAAAQFVAEGASLVGGCCGTTPAHIRAVARAVAPLPPPRLLARARRSGRAAAEVTAAEVMAAAGVTAAAALASPAPSVTWPGGPRFSVIAGLRAPQGSEVAEFVELARMLRQAGAHFLAITDPAPPMARVTPVAAGIVLHERLGADVILPIETADRSLSALQADLLGAHALGLRIIVCRTGTPRVMGDYPQMDALFDPGSQWDLDSVRLIAALAGLNDGVDWRGVAITQPTRFVIGALLSTSPADAGRELDRAEDKVRAGAHFLLTDVIYDLADARQMLGALRARDVQIPVIATIAPFEDPATVDRLAHEDPDRPARPLALARPGRSPTAQEATQAALEAVARLRGQVAGIIVHAPAGQAAQVAELISVLTAGDAGP